MSRHRLHPWWHIHRYRLRQRIGPIAGNRYYSQARFMHTCKCGKTKIIYDYMRGDDQ